MKKITSTFDEIAAQKNKFLLNPVVGLQTRPQYVVRESSSILTEPQIYGRDGDKQNITDMLLSNDLGNQDDLSVCPIIGIGGIGKTTLAQSVYNDERIVRWFQVRIWICVSEPFNVKKVLKAIIESYDKKDCGLENLESIQIRVGEILRNKRCLLVLDDVWNENRDEWNILKSSLNGGAKGSSIIVTTRLDTVASITGTLPNYILKPLSDDQCWSLFKSRAFGDRDEEPPNLVKIGKEIVERCKGVPLAAKSLGSMLWSKSEDSQWKLVRDSEIWKLTEDAKSGILPVLRFSYNYLPPQLRQCFAYCSIFPKDHKMGKDELIYLWIANGFIKSIGGVEPEDVGNEIFNLLLWRSFFQDAVKDERGNIVNCTMHDLMHDLASSVMENDSPSPKVDKETKVITNVRHFALNFDSQTASSRSGN